MREEKEAARKKETKVYMFYILEVTPHSLPSFTITNGHCKVRQVKLKMDVFALVHFRKAIQ